LDGFGKSGIGSIPTRSNTIIKERETSRKTNWDHQAFYQASDKSPRVERSEFRGRLIAAVPIVSPTILWISFLSMTNIWYWYSTIQPIDNIIQIRVTNGPLHSRQVLQSKRFQYATRSVKSITYIISLWITQWEWTCCNTQNERKGNGNRKKYVRGDAYLEDLVH